MVPLQMLNTGTRAKAHLPMVPTVLKILLCRVTKCIPLLWSFVLPCSVGKKKNPEIDAELIAVPKALNTHFLFCKGNEPTTPLDSHHEGSQDLPQVRRLTNACCQWLLYPVVSPSGNHLNSEKHKMFFSRVSPFPSDLWFQTTRSSDHVEQLL